MSSPTSLAPVSKIAWLASLIFAACSTQFTNAQPKPAFIYESMLQTSFDDESGRIYFDEYNLAFIPEGKLNASVAVVNSENTVVKSFKFFEDFRFTEGIFGKAMVQGPAEVYLTEPGVYQIVYLVDGEPVSRLPIVLEQTSEGDDPFDPVNKFRFLGMWQVYGYLTMNSFKDEEHPSLTFWVGMQDLAEGDDKDMFTATLKRGDEIIGHSKKTQGFIANKHYNRVDIELYTPHEYKDSANANFVSMEEWTKPGEYTIEITRQSDGKLIRRFAFTSKDDKIQPLKNSSLDFDPHIDYMAPRVFKRGSNGYDFEEAIWIKSE